MSTTRKLWRRISISENCVIFIAKITPQAFSASPIYIGDGNFTQEVVGWNKSNFPIPWIQKPVINDNGTVAFQVLNSSIWKHENINGSKSRITGIPDLTNISSFAFNNYDMAGVVANNASLNTRGVFRVGFSNHIETIVQEMPGGFSSISGPISINTFGGIAFVATRAADDRRGIFIGSDPWNDEIIVEGDALYGSYIKDFGFSREGLNDQGQVAFWVEFENGEFGIYRADPFTVTIKAPPGKSRWHAEPRLAP